MVDRSYLEQILSSSLRDPGKLLSVEEILGDASTRRYFRLVMEGDQKGMGNVSMIMMRYPRSHIIEGELQFLNTHRYFKKAGVKVPEIFLHVPEARLLFLEDGGDRTLEEVVSLSEFSPSTEIVYRRAMGEIRKIQVEGTQCLDESSLSGRLCFDRDKLMEEMDFLFTWGLRSAPSLSGGKNPRDLFLSLVEPVIIQLLSRTPVLCHRDFHSRNIMVRENEEIMILDFQDARMGNIYYDPASLLFDSYVILPEEMKRDLALEFSDSIKGESFASFRSFDEFYRNLNLMAIQRNLKALGTFFYMHFGRGKDRYIRYVEGTLDHLKKNPVLKEEFRNLSLFILPLLEEIAGTLEDGGEDESKGDDTRGGPGNKASPTDI